MDDKEVEASLLICVCVTLGQCFHHCMKVRMGFISVFAYFDSWTPDIWLKGRAIIYFSCPVQLTHHSLLADLLLARRLCELEILHQTERFKVTLSPLCVFTGLFTYVLLKSDISNIVFICFKILLIFRWWKYTYLYITARVGVCFGCSSYYFKKTFKWLKTKWI